MSDAIKKALSRVDCLPEGLIPESLDISIQATHRIYHKDRVEYFVEDCLTGKLVKIGEKLRKPAQLVGGT